MSGLQNFRVYEGLHAHIFHNPEHRAVASSLFRTIIYQYVHICFSGRPIVKIAYRSIGCCKCPACDFLRRGTTQGRAEKGFCHRYHDNPFMLWVAHNYLVRALRDCQCYLRPIQRWPQNERFCVLLRILIIQIRCSHQYMGCLQGPTRVCRFYRDDTFPHRMYGVT